MKCVRVIKLGGSLLTMADLGTAFHRWCDENPHPLTLVIVGGGEMVEAIRTMEQIHSLDESFCHWTCMDSLEQTARLAQRIIGNVDLYETADELQQVFSRNLNHSKQSIVAIVQTAICFSRDDPNPGLPASRDISSDAIAAVFCKIHDVPELVLMKSTDIPSVPMDVEGFTQLAIAGVVDPFFPNLAKNIPIVSFVNLRTY